MATITKLANPAGEDPLEYVSMESLYRDTGIPLNKLKEMDVTGYIKSASALVSAKLNQRFGYFLVENEFYNGSEEQDWMGNYVQLNHLKLDRQDVKEIVALEIEGTSIDVNSVTTDGSRIYLRDTAEKMFFPGHLVNSVKVDYKFGDYDPNKNEIIKQLTSKMASYLLLSSPKGTNALTKSLRDGTVEFGAAEFDAEYPEQVISRIGAQVEQLFRDLGIFYRV